MPVLMLRFHRQFREYSAEIFNTPQLNIEGYILIEMTMESLQ